jgi:hypothetical protein
VLLLLLLLLLQKASIALVSIRTHESSPVQSSPGASRVRMQNVNDPLQLLLLRPQRRLSFADNIHDRSKKHVLDRDDDDDDSVFLSSLSNSVLITGGLAYVALSLWDWMLLVVVPETHAPAAAPAASNSWYNALSLSAPLIYLLNSVIDITWAAKNAPLLLHPHKFIAQTWQHQERASTPPATSTTAAGTILDYASDKDIPWWWHRISKYDAQRHHHHHHHQTVLAAALTFGIAASLAVLAAVLRFFHVNQQQQQDVSVSTTDHHGLLPLLLQLDMASDHVYILSAIIATTGKRTRPWLTCSCCCCSSSSSQGYNNNNNITMTMHNNRELFQDLGDLLFLIGTLVDGSMWYFPYGKKPIWSLVSSLLWVLDACLYLRSNLLSKQAKQKSTKVL